MEITQASDSKTEQRSHRDKRWLDGLLPLSAKTLYSPPVSPIWSVAIAALMLTAAAAPAAAKPDFSRSRITINLAAPAERDIVTFTVVVINSGDEDAPFTEVKFELPLEAMFVGVDGLDNAAVNPSEKVLGATIPLAAGATRVFHVRMVIPRDAGGRVLTPDLTVRYLHQGVEFYGHEVYDIDTRVSQSGVKVGPVRVTPAGLAVLVFLLAFPVLWMAIRLMLPHGRVRDESGGMKGRHARNVGPATAAFALLLPPAFWTINSTVPCWYNPDDPSDVVVRNGFGGAYLFALFPLPVAAFGFYRTRALLRPR
jgi:hypothetical protein